MLNLLQDYTRAVRVNGKVYADGRIAYAAHLQYDGEVTIELNWQEEKIKSNAPDMGANRQMAPQAGQKKPKAPMMITVKQWMTKPATPAFDFHDKWNDGVPMPLRIMEVTKFHEETKGMVKLSLRGLAMPMINCCRCGRKLTHPVSMNYGIGPECGGHFYVGPEMDISEIKKKMQAIEWTGWIIKSAITSREEIKSA